MVLHLASLLTCKFCGHNGPGTKLLPCLHTVCVQCLQQKWSPQSLSEEKQDGKGGESDCRSYNRSWPQEVNCPFCQHKFGLPQGGPNLLKDACFTYNNEIKSPDPHSNNIYCAKCESVKSNKICHGEEDDLKKKKEKRSCQSSLNGDKTDLCKLTNEEVESSESVEKRQNNDFNKERLLKKNETMLEGKETAGYLKHEDGGEEKEEIQCYCSSCNTVFPLPEDVAPTDPRLYHQDHCLHLVEDVCEDKLAYLSVTLEQFKQCISGNSSQLLLLDNCAKHLDFMQQKIAEEIEHRAAHMITQIEAKKARLLAELRTTTRKQDKEYALCKKVLEEQQGKLDHAAKFGEVLLSSASCDQQVALCEDVAARMHQLMQQMKDCTTRAHVINMRVDAPDLGSTDLILDRTFGSLVMGTIQCGAAQCIKSFNIDLSWPTGLATTTHQELIVTGKKGAFEDEGQVRFYNCHGELYECYTLDQNSVPNDVIVSGNGEVLVTDNGGKVLHFNNQGLLKSVTSDVFRGVGRLASAGHNSFIVTSSEEKCLHVYDKQGKRSFSLPRKDSVVKLEHPHYVATNSKEDIVVSDFKLNTVFSFSSTGELLFQYSGSGTEGGNLQCPSAICCDAFDNVLIADFMHDRVHLVSSSGRFLGFLLASENGLACPNFLTLDADGHLFIGQYGGDISIFQYLSYIKHV